MRAWKKAKKSGEKRGEEVRARKDAKKMLDEGIDINIIMKVTELAKEEIENL